jgi:hypothetical protein
VVEGTASGRCFEGWRIVAVAAVVLVLDLGLAWGNKDFDSEDYCRI